MTMRYCKSPAQHPDAFSNVPRTLSTSTLDALKEFYADRDARQKQFEDLKAVAEEDASSGPGKTLSIDAFAENWNESQFWVCLFAGIWIQGW